MTLSFNSIVIDNFLSIGHVELDLSDSGYFLVYGENRNNSDRALSNGSGKSSIFEALVWCLTGTTTRGCKDVCNKFTEEGTLVKLVFIADNKEFCVIRSKEHSIYKTNLKVIVDNEDKSGKGIRDSEKILQQYLPDLNPLLISSVIVLGQGLPSKFSNSTPSGRKEILEKLSKSDFMIEDIKERVQRRKKLLSELVQGCKDSIIKTSTQLEQTTKELEEINNSIDKLSTISEYQVQIEELSKQQEEFEIRKLQCIKKDKSLNQYYDDLQDKKESLNNDLRKELEQSVTEFDSKLSVLKEQFYRVKSSLDSKTSELNKINSIVDICPTCGQKIPDVSKPDTSTITLEIDTLRNKVSIINQEILQLEKNKQNQSNLIKEKYNKSILEVNSNLSMTRCDLEDNNKILSDIQNKQRAVENSIQKIKTTIELLNKSKDEYILKKQEYKLEIEKYSRFLVSLNEDKEELSERLDIQNKFDSIVKRDFRGFLLQNVISYIDTKLKEYAKEVFGNISIEFKQSGNDIDITFQDKNYELLSGGEKQKLDILIQLSIRDMLCTFLGFNSSILVLDEVFDNLDSVGCKQIIDIISSKSSDIHSIYIISHHADELAIPVDRYITIIKDNTGVSYLKS